MDDGSRVAPFQDSSMEGSSSYSTHDQSTYRFLGSKYTPDIATRYIKLIFLRGGTPYLALTIGFVAYGTSFWSENKPKVTPLNNKIRNVQSISWSSPHYSACKTWSDPNKSPLSYCIK